MLSNYNFFLKQVALAMGTISCILTIFIGIWPRFNCSCMWGCCLFASIAWGFSSIIPGKEIRIKMECGVSITTSVFCKKILRLA